MICSQEATEKFCNPKSEIAFCPDGMEWAIKINKYGIKFNREKWPDCQADAFAQAFMDILEKKFNVTFEKIENKN